LVEWFVVFFGHFYQPPRFNPWIEFVDYDISASPFHDWNERVAIECYSRLSNAPLYSEDGRVLDVVNIYSRISFSFGPLLLEWLRSRFPRVYDAVVEADKESLSREGFGNAIAQPYSHIIMPLADRRYKELAVNWGVKFFERTFERYPEGFWLPEAAVDYETLEVLADYGIKYVVLAPHQIEAIRVGGRWVKVGRADPRISYRIVLPSGRSIAAVVYDDILSREVSFGNLLDDGRALASRITESFNELLQEPQLVSIASDGEVYGHHRKRGVEELSRALSILDSIDHIRVTNYSKFLAVAPPRVKARVAERTSWSCPHGVERWRANCGCGSEIRPGWSQEWRAPLRRAVDLLSSEVLRVLESRGAKLFKDPWAAALEYIEVLYGRELGGIALFMEKHLLEKGSPGAVVEALKVLEALRNALLAQSSDAWFFEDLYRFEPLQALKHIARSLELLEDLGIRGYEATIREVLRSAQSNRGIRGDELVDEIARSKVDPAKIVAIYAVKSLRGSVGDEGDVYSYTVSRSRRDRLKFGSTQIDMGVVNVLSKVTLEQNTLYYVLIHLGGWNFYVGVGYLERPEDYIRVSDLFKSKVALIPQPALVELLNEQFKGNVYTLSELPLDDQVDVALWVLEDLKSSLKGYLEGLLSTLVPLQRLLKATNARIPGYLTSAISTLLAIRLEESLREPSLEDLRELMKLAEDLGVPVDPYVEELLSLKLLELLERVEVDPLNVRILEGALSLAVLLDEMGALEGRLVEEARVKVALLRNRYYSGIRSAADAGDEVSWVWIKLFTSLSRTLRVRV